ncbi:ribokinase [Clostridiales bacterium COT073_COT-073]|nr:ribokinase [Clostridiales bacterium COT073_COT-073]
MKILNFGSLNIDYVYSVDHFVKQGETIASLGLEVFSGGKGLNQSIAMGRAGIEVYHAGAVGKDGESLVQLLDQDQVDTRFIRVLEEVRSGNAIIQRDKQGDNCIILYGGANQSITSEQIDETLAYFQTGDFLVLQNEINQMSYLIEKARERDLKIVLNPSPLNEKIMDLQLSAISYFILNEIEAKGILGNGQADEEGVQAEDLARKLSEKFPNAGIVLTLGGEGSIYVRQTEMVRQPIYPAQVKDTTAAGDTFTGYFVAGLVKDWPVEKCMDLAAKAASITVSRLGAAPSIPRMAEVEAMFPAK